jgi:cytosine/adenosine deaminase-related metal-dependent hydrolase
MKTLLRNLARVVTCDEAGTELVDADVLINGPAIDSVGRGISDRDVDRVIDGRGLLALPGLVNAHQHLYQGALRALPELERVLMDGWLAGVGARSLELWRAGRFGAPQVKAVARALLVESLLGGVTTTADQHYFFPGDDPEPYVEATIAAAEEVGVRLHAARGTITLGRSNGGAADDTLVESVDAILAHCQQLIERHHDPKPFAKVRVALAPCGVHVDLPELFESFADLAADHEGVRLHTHLYERIDTSACIARYGITPWEFLKRHGWASDQVWVAHGNDPPLEEIPEFAQAGVGLAHLIAPDLRLGWGLAPVREYLDNGVTLGFGTTGSASNDGSNVMGDLRLAMLAHRSAHPTEPEKWPTARELIRMATAGSAACLGRPDLGAIASGRAADIACWDLTTVDRFGLHDPVAGVLLAGLSDAATLVIVNGEVLVEAGRLTKLDADEVARTARSAVGL